MGGCWSLKIHISSCSVSKRNCCFSLCYFSYLKLPKTLAYLSSGICHNEHAPQSQFKLLKDASHFFIIGVTALQIIVVGNSKFRWNMKLPLSLQHHVRGATYNLHIQIGCLEYIKPPPLKHTCTNTFCVVKFLNKTSVFQKY